jgi:colanic acid/amylovoran biosynthesis glycosyltransferase
MLGSVERTTPRIVLVTDRFPTASETFIFQRFVRLLDRGWDMHVFCSESRVDERAMFPQLTERPELLERVHVRPRRRPKVVSTLLLPFVALRTLVRAPRALLRYLVRGRTATGALILRTLYYDRSLIELQPDVVHFTFGGYAPGRGYVATAIGTKLAVSFQGADISYGGLGEDPGYYDDVWRSATLIHFLSEDLRRRAIARGYVPDGRDVMILPGIDVNVFVPQPRERATEGPIGLLGVGRLHWKKGYEYALQAVRMLRDEGVDLRYRIVGDGPEREAVVYAIHDLGLQDVVTLLGPQPASRILTEMQWADVFLHSSTSEGFCYAAVEAQAMGLPVVTSDADGLPENVADGQTGFVVPRRDADALARALSKLVGDPELRRRMGEAGRARVLTNFDVEREIAEFDAFYRRVLDG